MARSRTVVWAVHDVMVPRQLLVRELDNGQEELEAVSVADATTLPALEDERGAYAPVLGTVDLVLLAGQLQAAGYRIRNLELRTPRFQPLSGQDGEEYEQQLVAILRSSGAAAVLDELDDKVRSMLVVGFDMRTPAGDIISLKRSGAILNQEQLDVTPFLDDLRSSWRRVRGS